METGVWDMAVRRLATLAVVLLVVVAILTTGHP